MFARLLQPNRRDFSTLDEREILSLAVAAEEEDGGDLCRDRRAAALDGIRPPPRCSKAWRPRKMGIGAGCSIFTSKSSGRGLCRSGAEAVCVGLPDAQAGLADGDHGARPGAPARFEMEEAAVHFYTEAAARTTDTAVRKLLGDLAVEERQHATRADQPTDDALGPEERASGEIRRTPAVRADLCPAGPRRPDGWLGARPWRRCSRRRSRPAIPGRPSSSALLPPWAPAFRWALPRRRPMTGKLTGRGSPITARRRHRHHDGAGRARARAASSHPHFWLATGVAAFVVLIELRAISLHPEPLHARRSGARCCRWCWVARWFSPQAFSSAAPWAAVTYPAGLTGPAASGRRLSWRRRRTPPEERDEASTVKNGRWQQVQLFLRLEGVVQTFVADHFHRSPPSLLPPGPKPGRRFYARIGAGGGSRRPQRSAPAVLLQGFQASAKAGPIRPSLATPSAASKAGSAAWNGHGMNFPRGLGWWSWGHCRASAWEALQSAGSSSGRWKLHT